MVVVSVCRVGALHGDRKIGPARGRVKEGAVTRSRASAAGRPPPVDRPGAPPATEASKVPALGWRREAQPPYVSPSAWTSRAWKSQLAWRIAAWKSNSVRAVIPSTGWTTSWKRSPALAAV